MMCLVEASIAVTVLHLLYTRCNLVAFKQIVIFIETLFCIRGYFRLGISRIILCIRMKKKHNSFEITIFCFSYFYSFSLFSYYY